MEQPELDTEKLILRPFVEDDAPRIAELAGDAEVADTTLRIPHPYTSEMASVWISTHKEIREKGRALFYAIDNKESSELIGSTGIDIDLLHERAEIGYWIGREYWNRGYATEAAARLLGYVFTVLNLHKVTAHCFARNPGSWHVLEKLGMNREGLLRGHILNSGEWEDIVQYGILETEYEKLEAGLQRSG